MKSKKKAKKVTTKKTVKSVKIVPTPIEAAPVVVASPAPPPPSTAQKIWEQIRHIELQMFGLPNQTIEKYCTPAFVEPTKLYLTFKIGTVLPMMEEVFRDKFIIERVDKYITVTPVVKGK